MYYSRIYLFQISFLIGCLLGISNHTLAQIQVNDTENLETVIKRLEGTGVKISNIKYRLSPKAKKRPAGSFSDDFGALGIANGLIMTSGAAVNAIGPNDEPGKTQINEDPFQDPELTPFIEKYDSVNNRMYDECVVEFDFVSAYPSVSFDYIFGSDEYIEFLEYHDILAFLISGPGISGQKNIAMVPGTNIPVSVASIKPGSHEQFYISNGHGNTPFLNVDVQYDGYTKVLRTYTEVIPCETYHLKLAIADVLDDTFDAALFVQQGSFQSELKLEVAYEHQRYDDAIEGCNDAYMIFKRPASSDKSQDLNYKFVIKGNATNGLDYTKIPEEVTIPAGKDSAFITIEPLLDNIADNGEIVKILVINNCPEFPYLDSLEVTINEFFPYVIPPAKACDDTPVVLNPNPLTTDSIFWANSDFLSCLKCSSPVATFSGTPIYFHYTVKDNLSGCFAKDSVKLETLNIEADFSYYIDPCYSAMDVFFINKSQNANQYVWDFGDNKSSVENSPQHQYPLTSSKDMATYKVKLTAISTNPSCQSDTTIEVRIENPLFVPNLITSNKDGKNDCFELLGITPGCWHLAVYNRWGKLVFESSNYNNDFCGEGLSDGVYYFAISNSSKDRTYKNWIHLIKN